MRDMGDREQRLLMGVVALAAIAFALLVSLEAWADPPQFRGTLGFADKYTLQSRDGGVAIAAIGDVAVSGNTSMASIDGGTSLAVAGASNTTALTVSGTRNKACVALVLGSATATVDSAAVCTCSNTTATATPVICAVAASTLTLTGVATETVCYHCL